MDTDTIRQEPGKRFAVRRRWLVVLSLAWIAIVYLVWIATHGLGSGPDQISSECRSFVDAYPDAYAQCVGIVNQLTASRRADVAATATLIAFLPVLTVWSIWFSLRFMRLCKDC